MSELKNKKKLSGAALLITVVMVNDAPGFIRYPLLFISIILMLWNLYNYYKISEKQIGQKAGL
ncbi:hypothetical protein [Pedobacter sp.]|uniref:hypothetical protein n=1 Tax=Pedobacter sp. TaxID=1411316 RepID=UPI003BAD618C